MSASRLIGVFLFRVFVAILLIAPIWGLAYSYMTFAPKTYATEIFMILPGEGGSSSVNLDQVGQASSSSRSPWSSNKLSPVESYRKLIMTETVHRRAAAQRDMLPEDFPRPKIKLIDQTNFITIQIKGKSPEAAQANAQALLDAFYEELNQLRTGFADARERPNRSAIRTYQDNVNKAREAIVAFQARTGLASEDQFNERIALVERSSKRVRDVEAELERQAGEVRTLQLVLGADATQAALALKLRADPVFQALLEEMSAAKIVFEKARIAYGAKHPKYLSARREYVSLTDAMIERGKVITGKETQEFRSLADLATHGQRELMLGTMVEQAASRDGLMSELVTLRSQHSAAIADVKRLAGPAAKLDHLIREHQVALAVFASALAKADTTKADQFAAYPLAQIVEVPLANPEPVSPSRKIAIIAAIAATFFILMGLMMIWMRGPILRWVGRAFAHPANDIAVAAAAVPASVPQEPVREVEAAPAPAPAIDPLVMRPPVRTARAEPEMPIGEPLVSEEKPLDDEPLIEIPHQTPYRSPLGYGVGEVMSVRLRTSDDTG